MSLERDTKNYYSIIQERAGVTQMGYVNDMIKTLDIASAFIHGKGVRWCPDCGVELVLSPKDPWINGVLCPHCKRMFSWQQWAHFGEKWRWGEDNTSLVSFHGDEADVEVPHHCTRVCSYAFSNSTLLQNHDYNGAIVVMDYTTGEILAMVSTPSVDVLDPEDFEAGAFLCKATTAYAPGSTMKAVTAAAVLEKNTAAAEAFTYDCTGADSYASCYQTTAHGVQHLDTILSHSCNCGTGAIARTMLLPDELNRYAQNAHLLDADIIRDFDCQSGNIDANDDLTWSAIGQSADLVTPVGMCAFYSAIANDGIMVSPHLFSGTETEEKRIMRTDTARYISDALIPVAASTDVACTAFGKTGSAEVEGADAHSWFVCSLMDENAPTYTIAVFLENGGGAYYAKLLLAEFTNLYILGGD